MYHNGKGVTQDDKIAFELFSLAAAQGNNTAQYWMGQMYRQRKGVPQDDKTAVKWYRLAAKQGYADAQFNLGNAYNRGHGIPQDYKTAVKWYTLAAEQGVARAQSNLGVMYAMGKGVIRDNVYAHMWWNIAATSGDKDAIKNRNIVAKQMTSAQLAEAQKLARECIQKKYKGCMNLSSKPAEQSAPPANNAPSLNEAKKECADLGFKPKTEKFGTCVLQLTDN